MAKEHSCKCASCTASAKQATVRERERIVEMLQEQAIELYSIGFIQGGDQIRLAISFIKGENE